MSNEKPRLPGPRPTVQQGAANEVRDHKDDIFFAAIELTRMPMLVTDPRQPDNPIVFANRAFVAMSGYELDDVLGRNCRFLQGPDTDRDTVAAVRDAVETRTEISVEILNYRKDGSSFWNALFVSPVFNHAGELVYFFASQLDVSRRRDAEEALAQAQKMEALGQLTGGISHDFNNLLQVMAGRVDFLGLKARMGRLEPGELDQGLAAIRAAVDKASTLTQHLLAFSRKQTLRGRVVNLNASTKAMQDLVGRTLGEGIHVVYELDPDLPNCQLDNTQFEMALLNLFVNARDALPDGGRIHVRTARMDVGGADRDAVVSLPPGGYASIAITDDGVGIPPQLINRVMEPFFTTKDVGKGTGMGLSSVYGFAKQSGGAASIYSEPGMGTTVRLYFPAIASALGPQSLRVGTGEVRGGNERVLVVDDRPEIADLAAEILKSTGYSVEIAYSGADALACMEAMHPQDFPQLLFTDVVMPGGMNGYMLAHELRRRHPALQVLLTSGFDRDLAGLQGDAPSEFELLKKPYSMTDLLRRVRMILDGATGPKL
ncbi:MAG TPA: histidine kinase famiy protein [Lysobacter sp.]